MNQAQLLVALSVATLIVAAVGAVYAALTHRMKSGIEVRGTYCLMSSIAAEDQYISEVILHNLKDRAVVVFKILLEVGHGDYIELEDFDSEPLILRPFEALRREYEPIDRYSINMRRVRLNALLASRKTRMRLVLAKADGRYDVARYLNRWDPNADFFRNHSTGIFTPLRSIYEGKAYGSGTKYLVKLTQVDGRTEVIPIYARDIRRFRRFDLTAESLTSKEALERFLLERAVAGDLPCDDLSVLNLEEWRREAYADSHEPFDALPRSWFTYHVLGRVATVLENIRMNRRNEAQRRKHQQALKSRASDHQS